MLSQRISIVGTSGSGKTTLACQLSQRFGMKHVELDALHWEPNWTEAPDQVFQARVTEALSSDRWVADGNYSKVRDVIWSRADTVVWLDYSLPVVLSRVIKRSIFRIITQEELWNGNRENLKKTLSRGSIVLWSIQTYEKRRREYPILFSQPQYAHLHVVQLRSPEATQTWIETLSQTAE